MPQQEYPLTLFDGFLTMGGWPRKRTGFKGWLTSQVLKSEKMSDLYVDAIAYDAAFDATLKAMMFLGAGDVDLAIRLLHNLYGTTDATRWLDEEFTSRLLSRLQDDVREITPDEQMLLDNDPNLLEMSTPWHTLRGGQTAFMRVVREASSPKPDKKRFAMLQQISWDAIQTPEIALEVVNRSREALGYGLFRRTEFRAYWDTYRTQTAVLAERARRNGEDVDPETPVFDEQVELVANVARTHISEYSDFDPAAPTLERKIKARLTELNII